MSNYKSRVNDKYQMRIDLLLQSLPDFVFSYVDAFIRVRSKKTIESYISKYMIFFSFLCDKHPYFCDKEPVDISIDDLSNISTEDATSFLNFLYNHQVDDPKNSNTNNTVESYSSALNSLFKYLLQEEKIANNPFANVKRKHEEVENPAYLKGNENSTFYIGVLNGEGLSPKQLAYREAHHTAYRDYLICRMLGTTGIRVSELVGLNVEDLDLKHQQFKVIRKGRNKPQTVYLSDKICEELNHYIDKVRPYYQTERTDIPIEEKKALFKVAQGEYFGQRMSVKAIERIVEKYAKAQAITDAARFHPHSLRHSMGMVSLAKSQNLRLVQQILGHKNISTTTIYARMSEEDLRNNRNIGEV